MAVIDFLVVVVLQLATMQVMGKLEMLKKAIIISALCLGSQVLRCHTTLQFVMNTKLSPHRLWSCHENGLIKTIQTIPHKLFVSFMLTSLYCGLRIILVYPNPQ